MPPDRIKNKIRHNLYDGLRQAYGNALKDVHARVGLKESLTGAVFKVI